jgi:hypothetical protein
MERKYSEEDLRKAYYQGRKEAVNSVTNKLAFISPDDYIQSLKHPKWFVAEMTVVSDEIDHIYSGNIRYGLKTITINNKTYLVGTYSN